MKLILASGSPRRKELLHSIGLEFTVDVPQIDEVLQPGEIPLAYVSRLAREKAEAVAGRHPEAWVLAADTTVEIDSLILEKPLDDADAEAMLARLSGRTHVVWTGVAIMRPDGWTTLEHARSEVTIAPLSPAEIRWYVSTREPMDKAGAYAVQGIGALFIESVNGSYTNVVGLPLATVRRMLTAAGIDLTSQISPSIMMQSQMESE